MKPRHLQLLSTLVVLTWAIGVWTSFAASPRRLLWWRIEPRESVVAPYQPLARFAAGATEVDYLVDLTPAGQWQKGVDQRRRRRRQRGRNRLHFHAQYALAPAIVQTRGMLAPVRQRAGELEPYYLLWDAAFHSSLEDVLAVLTPIAERRGLALEVHMSGSELGLIVLRRG